MLDQNTDRMWFVIGALVVGAGIILLANKTMPEVFANVANTFKSVADESTKSASKLKVQQGNLINAADAMRVWSVKTNINSWGPEFVRTTDLAPIIEKYGLDQKYDLSFDIKSEDISKNDSFRIYMQNGQGSKYAIYSVGETVYDSTAYKYADVTTDFQRVTLEDIQFRESNMSFKNAYLAFYGTYDTGNVLTVKNLYLSLAD